MSLRYPAADNDEVGADDGVAGDDPIDLGEHDGATRFRRGSGRIHGLLEGGRHVGESLCMSAEWRGRHRDSEPVPEFPAALPLSIVVDRVSGFVVRRRAHTPNTGGSRPNVRYGTPVHYRKDPPENVKSRPVS
jgi:hypothetical protein